MILSCMFCILLANSIFWILEPRCCHIQLFTNFVQVGKLTSYTPGRNESDHFGLGYIKRQAAVVGGTVTVGDNIIGTVIEVPFLAQQHLLLTSSSS